MKKINWEKYTAIAYIFLMLGMSLENVGRMPMDADKPFDFGLVVAMAFCLIVPTALGYFAGRKDANGG